MRAWGRIVPLAVLLAACTPKVQDLGAAREPPRLEATTFVSADGERLPLEVWPAAGEARAVLVALHGFNDYRNAFRDAAAWWARQGIVTYAFDQRGFGETGRRGIWGGAAAMKLDAQTAIRLVRERHPGLPVHLLGESMGGAVALLAAADPEAPAVDGLILSAPAVWGAGAMSPFYRVTLWLGAHLFPASTFTGRGLGRLASDNLAMLRALGKDPQVIKQTRLDAIYGLTRLMGRALEAVGRVRSPVLLLYGAHDEVIPASAVREMAEGLARSPRIALYPAGWHMLLRDCQAPAVWRDVTAWLADPASPLPSGAEVGDPGALKSADARGPVPDACPAS